MMVVIDTSVWSEYFRRKKKGKSKNVEILKGLIWERRAVIPGIVKQELLSGIKDKARFEKLKEAISGFVPLLAKDEDHVLAAMYFNQCRLNGVQGAFYDFLICAQASQNSMSILTSDNDFKNYSKHIPIKLWSNVD